MRIAIAKFGQETSSFSPVVTTLETFKLYGLYEGGHLLQQSQGVGPIGGFLAAAEEDQVELTPLPLIRGWAGASGIITTETLAYFEEKIVTGLEAALPIDGMFFDLHGAGVAENVPDTEGYLLTAARRVMGNNIPLVIALDHHANITQQMIECIDGLVGHRTQPHQPFETGYLAGKMLMALLRGEITPTIAWHKIPLITHQEQFLTDRGPMKLWFDLARDMERQPGVLSVSPFPMQPWLDVPEGGWSTVVITDNDPLLAKKLSAELANKAWQLREQFCKLDSIPPAAAIQQAAKADRGLVVLLDTGDSIWGGATGDSTCLLAEMLTQNIAEEALVPMVDSEVVEQAIEAGIGAEITVRLGGKLDNHFSLPVEVTGRVAAIGGGRFNVEVIGHESFDMGRAVLLEVGSIKIVVMEKRGISGNHPIVYRHFRVEPADARMVVLKTASNWQYYQPMISEVIRADTPGATMSQLDQFDWTHLPRPIYPLDALEDWKAKIEP